MLLSITTFRQGTTITTAEGHTCGTIQHLYLLAPTRTHILLSKLLLPQYYHHPLRDNLWSLRNTAEAIARATTNTAAQRLLTLAQQHGVSLFALLHIINSPQ